MNLAYVDPHADSMIAIPRGASSILPGSARVCVVTAKVHTRRTTAADTSCRNESENVDLVARARALARRIGLPYVEANALDAHRAEFDLYLVVSDRGLALHETHVTRSRPVLVDFVLGRDSARTSTRQLRKEPLGVAVGAGRGVKTVIDATAGLGRDTLHLARVGLCVTAVERSPVLYALLEDALARARAHPDRSVQETASRIRLIHADARTYLSTLPADQSPDAVYLDPMFPPKRRSAVAKKEMRICRWLVGDDPDAAELLAIARRVARRRVIVKRHPHAPPLSADVSRRITGKLVSLEVYFTQR